MPILPKHRYRVAAMHVLLLVLLFSLVGHAYAQDPTGATESTVLSFERLGIEGGSIETPFGSRTYRFGLPAEWELNGEAVLQINFDGYMRGNLGSDFPASEDAPMSVAGLMFVEYNDVDLPPIAIDLASEGTVSITLTPEMLVSRRSDGLQELQITLDFGFTCDNDEQAVLFIRNDSRLVLPYTIGLPSTDLRNLPQPFLQRSFDPDTAVLVMPDAPSAIELAAALNTAAAFGKMTDNRLGLTTLTASQITPEVQAAENLIIVGTQANVAATTSEVTLPQPVDEVSDSDGMLQMAVSPWNPAKVILVVSGSTDEGVLKAAEALAADQVRVTTAPSLAIVSQVRSDVQANEISQPVMSFDNLGYTDILIENLGDDDYEISFGIDPEVQAAEGARVDLRFSHSPLLDFEESYFNL